MNVTKNATMAPYINALTIIDRMKLFTRGRIFFSHF
jgi:hypothetical protein